MNISVIGSGYVGLVTGACFADVGNHVLCLDIDESKVQMLREGRLPIHEPGLGAMVKANVDAGRLQFSTSYDEAVAHADVVFLAVGTPPGEDGSADLTHILNAARQIGQRIGRPIILVDKSTVPVGTAELVRQAVKEEVDKRGLELAFTVVSNPEFLREGAAIKDFTRPDRIVIGSDDAQATARMRQLYAPFSRNHEKMVVMDVRSAELTKYAANAMLATRISFMNELANLAEQLGADIEAVRQGIGMDPRIGSQFLYAGMGYGGSCFPKDVKALIKTARDYDQQLLIMKATERVNEQQKYVLYRKLCRFLGGETELRGKTIALWGLSFKPNTDDMREAPSLVLIDALFGAGARVAAYDPVASRQAQRILVARHGSDKCAELLTIARSAKDAVRDADVLMLVTEWTEFRSPDWKFLAQHLRKRAVFDGRNIYDPHTVAAAGLAYEGIGRRMQAVSP
ncbi:UDP-glucose 6-dehydrogenase [Massilia sp. KIM]|uniref:UDP-glucose dehydrogenase family protein n=1 Tax=Massilia sp. KIM TaxID=1955422 RepID=UPI0009900344|nr:UDP-glucose/GDP-mannose dehydrogenase family protein [Massilia sp. KIM]OON60505.1 UDP-glucose 6-dehydrogenase [Massilia sp. KIM]